MFKHFGLLVEKLKRVRIGPIDLGPIKPGQFRHLDEDEVEKLKRAIHVQAGAAHRMRRDCGDFRNPRA